MNKRQKVNSSFQGALKGSESQSSFGCLEKAQSVSDFKPFLLFIIPHLIFALHPCSSTDCESHCKASKGKMKVTMKKYCKKDFGE